MPAETGFNLEPDRVIEAMGPETAAVVLCRPSNPTGRVYDAEAVRAVAEAAADHDAVVIADEVYLSLTYEGDERGVAALVDDATDVLTVGSCSKRYAMTGWRVGWLAGRSAVIEEATKIREATTACTASVAQHAALAALTGPQEPFEEMHEAFAARRDYVVDRVGEIDGIDCPRPEGAFYALLDVDLPGKSLDVAKRLLTEYGVVLAPGGGFGDAGEGRLRLSFATDRDRLREGFDRIERALADG
jgi:aspartate aminotransferase